MRRISHILSGYVFAFFGAAIVIAGIPRRLFAKEIDFDPPGHDLQGELGLPGDPQGDGLDIVLNFINWALGLLGLVAVIYIIIGGYMYLTSGGNEERVDKAKMYIKNAVIGLVVVLLSWAIAFFAFETILNEAS